jgi:hypothetical protein
VDGKRKEAAKKSGDEAEKAGHAFSDARTNAELAVRLTSNAAQAQAAAGGAAAPLTPLPAVKSAPPP